MNIDKILKELPPMVMGEELVSKLQVLSEYDNSIREQDLATRLMAVSDLYNIYIPTKMSMEIYSRLYVAMVRSLQKKGSKMAVLQRNINHVEMQTREYGGGIIGGADSFTILGRSGIGKSTGISRAISIMTENKVIEVDEPYTKIIPCLLVQIPFDSSPKSMFLEILRKVDETIGSDYYIKATKNRLTTDLLIGMVSTVALNHIGLLVCDEIQNVANSTNGKSLIGALTQLINSSGISICMVGLPESAVFFQQDISLSRRSLGLNYSAMNYDREFVEICRTLFEYQYVKNRTEITDTMVEWLFEHSAGIISIVISLLHDAQEIALLNGTERLDLGTLNEAYQTRLSLLHEHLESEVIHKRSTSKPQKRQKGSEVQMQMNSVIAHNAGKAMKSISEIAGNARKENREVVELLRQYYSVEEIPI